MKRNYVATVCVLMLVVFVVVLTFIGCGGASSSDSGSSTPAPTPITQTIWTNGAASAWNNDAVTGAITVYNVSGSPAHYTLSSVSVVDNISGGITSLQLASTTSSVSGEFANIYAEITNLKVVNNFAGGHLRFNMRLDDSNITVIEIQPTSSSNGKLTLSATAFNSSTFTHVNIPIPADAYETQVVFFLKVFNPGPSYSARPLATINDIKWTTD